MHLQATLLLVAAAARVAAQQCPGDTTGCWMCEGSPLMQCLNAASASVEQCFKQDDDDQPACLCAAYAFTADCWAVGKNCLEWRPNAIAAVEMCSAANSLANTTTVNGTSIAPSSLPSASLSSLIALQSQVTSSVWHDDSGTDIPTLDQESTLPYVPTATHLTNAFATAMSQLETSASSGASYSGPSVVLAPATAASAQDTGRKSVQLVTQTGVDGVVVSGDGVTGAPRPTGSLARTANKNSSATRPGAASLFVVLLALASWSIACVL